MTLLAVTRRALGTIFVALLLALCGWSAAAAATGIPGVVTGLERSRVYVDPTASPPRVDAARLLAVTPRGTYFASLPASLASSVDTPAELPALLSNKVGKGGTFIVLLAGKLYGASTTIPGRLGGELAAAQAALPTGGGDATAALSDLMRSLAGAGDLQDAQSPRRAGSPVGSGLLLGLLAAALVGAALLWWRLKRTPRRPRRPKGPPPPPRDLVEIDHAGRVIRRVPGSERES